MIVEESCVWDSTFRTTVDAWRRLGAPWMSSCYDFTPRRRCWPETRRSTSNTKGKKVPFQWLGYLRFNRVVFDHHNKFQGFWPMTFSLNISATFWCPMQWLNDYGHVLGDANNSCSILHNWCSQASVCINRGTPLFCSLLWYWGLGCLALNMLGIVW